MEVAGPGGVRRGSNDRDTSQNSIEFLLQGPSSAGMSNEQVAFVRARDLVREHAGGGDESENITVHEIPRREAAAWLDARRRAGFAIDPKLYAGLWFIERNPDGGAA